MTVPNDKSYEAERFEWDVPIDALLLPVRQAVARKNTTNAELKAELTAAKADARRWHQYVDSMIGMLPIALRRFVTSRLDETGRSVKEDGLWNYILDRTASYEAEARSPTVGRAERLLIEAALAWLAEARKFESGRTLTGNRAYTEKQLALHDAVVALAAIMADNQ